MSNTTTYISCPAIQENLDLLFKGNDTMMRKPTPVLKVLTSAENTSNFLQNQIDDQNGKTRQVQAIYQNRWTSTKANDSADLNCGGGTFMDDKSTTYSIDPSVGTGVVWSITPAQLVKRCEDNGITFARGVQQAINAALDSMEKKTITQLVSLLGNFATTGTSTAIDVATLNSQGLSVPNLIDRLKYEFAFMEHSENPLFLFYTNFSMESYFAQMAYRCCSSTFGLDLNEYFANQNIMPFFSLNVDTLLGANKFFALTPGAAQLLTFNQFRGYGNEIGDDSIKMGVIYDPDTGIPFDYYAQFQCGTWNFQVKVAHKLVGIPTDAFATDDSLKGVTWANQFRVVNP